MTDLLWVLHHGAVRQEMAAAAPHPHVKSRCHLLHRPV